MGKGKSEALLTLDSRGLLRIPERLFSRANGSNELKLYCVKGESGKSCLKIVSSRHPFAQNLKESKTASPDSLGRIRIPKELIAQAELYCGGKVLVTGGSHLEVWHPANYDLEWKAVLEAAGIEATP
ncbi:division/cell wall cluster transcriptional repressor MraZ [Patescibacteria group bacterium]|nr:division/cell wall cluster transcriptional repressor MraZ [Patescibacteria group bacterium]